MTDGYGASAFASNVTDEWDADLLPHLPPFNLWIKIMTLLAFPYNFFKLAYQYTLYPADMNPLTRLNKDKGNSGVKQGFFAKEYKVEDIKRKSKELKVTINDLLMTAISMTVKQYFLRKGDEKTDHILMFVPFNLRAKPSTRDDFSFINEIAVFPVTLPLVTEFKTGLPAIQRTFLPLRTSFITFAMFYLMKIQQLMPSFLSIRFFLKFANKTTLLTTNVRGPAIPYKVAGACSIKATTFVPNLADIPGGFAAVSHMEALWVSFSADTNRCKDAKEIVQIFEQTLDAILAAK